MSQQMTFDFDSEPRPVVPVDTHLKPEEKPRLSRQAQVILEALQRGPMTNAELVKIATRFGARLHDIRRAGYTIEISDRDHKTGLVTYRLV